MTDFQLLASSMLFSTIIPGTPLLLLIWFGGHRHTLKRLANGEPVIHVPHKSEQTQAYEVGCRTVYIRPYHGPLYYLGATASAGMLRRWSILMAVVCLTVLGSKAFFGNQWWYGALGYSCVLMSLLYADDIDLIPREIENRVAAFALVHMFVGVILSLTFADIIGWIIMPHTVFYCGILLALLVFACLATLPVPSDDIIHQIKSWKKQRKSKRK